MTTMPHRLRFFPLAALAAMSCGDGSPAGMPTESTTRLQTTATQDVYELLTCSPLPADTVTVTLSTDGGTLRVGPHELTVPAGALDGPVTITAVAPSDSTNRVEFAPAGLVFDQAAWLTMSYANCGDADGTPAKRVAYINDLLTILELPLSVDDPEEQAVTGHIEHFSGYAVAW